jgi:hypothetical protein
MVRTTRAQREMLRNVFQRTQLTRQCVRCGSPVLVTYRDFRKTVTGTFACDGAIAVPWCGMWLCIERDGYCHS